MIELQRDASQARSKWQGKTFEEFERSVYKEPFPNGKYIVDGDTTIANKKQLEEFFNRNIATDPSHNRVASLVVNSDGGDTFWDSTQRKHLTYCVSTSFGNRYNQVVQAMQDACGAWESVADIDFVHLSAQDGSCTAGNNNVVFDVRPVNVGGEYLARAFFPNDARASRNVLIDNSSFQLDPPPAKLQLVGILRHELGHTLGFRHEHTRPESGACFEDTNWTPLTSYDKFSVMHYPQCNGGGDWSLTLTSLDQNGAACLYTPAPGFTVDGSVCVVRGEVPASSCAVQKVYIQNQSVAKGSQKQYGPYNVAPGTGLKVEMSGTGDPDLYVRFSQVPTRSTGGFDCRPYLDGATEACTLDVPAGQTQAFVMVYGYAAANYDLAVSFTSN